MKKSTLLIYFLGTFAILLTACIKEEAGEIACINPCDVQVEALVESCDIRLDSCREVTDCYGQRAYCEKTIDCLGAPICRMEFENQVDSCDNKAHCYENTFCGNTIYCQLKEECIGLVEEINTGDTSSNDQEASNAQAAGGPNFEPQVPLSSNNQIKDCAPEFLSPFPCTQYEIDNRTCFAQGENNACLGNIVRYCRPIYEEGLDCAQQLICQDGYIESNRCAYDQMDCYTFNACNGTIFCQLDAPCSADPAVPTDLLYIEDCSNGVINNEACTPDEIQLSSCGYMLPNECGAALLYCHFDQIQCDAYPVCQGYEQEVMSCEGLENCHSSSLCGATIYCQLRPECVGLVDPNSDSSAGAPAPAPVMLTPNQIDRCDPIFLTENPCTADEIQQNTCFGYEQSNACFGTTVQYCRPQYEGACAFLVRCPEGEAVLDACLVGDQSCHTITGCAGTVFCQYAEMNCRDEPAPEMIPELPECVDGGLLNSEPCTAEEVSANRCGAVRVPNRCMGSDIFYCHF